MQQLGQQTQLQTLSEYSTRVLSPNNAISRRVRKVASRIIEANGLGRVKSGSELGAIEGKVPSWGGGGASQGGMELDMGEVLFGGDKGADEGKDTEWEVSLVNGFRRTARSEELTDERYM
jgi:hypothetical protein